MTDCRCVDACLRLLGLPCHELLHCLGCDPDLWPQGSWGTAQWLPDFECRDGKRMDFFTADGLLPPSNREEVSLCLSSVTMHLRGLNPIDWVTSCNTLDAALFLRWRLRQRFAVEGHCKGSLKIQHTWSLGLIGNLLQLGSVCLSDTEFGESFPRIFIVAIQDYFFSHKWNLYVEIHAKTLCFLPTDNPACLLCFTR